MRQYQQVAVSAFGAGVLALTAGAAEMAGLGGVLVATGAWLVLLAVATVIEMRLLEIREKIK